MNRSTIASSVGALFALALAASSCAARDGVDVRSPQAAQPSRPVAQFPQLVQVREVSLGEAPDLAPLLSRSSHHVESWQVTSTPAPGDVVYEPADDPFEALLDRVALARNVEPRRSASLRCVANEIARFYGEHQQLPTNHLTHFLLAACGSSAVEYEVRTSGGEVAANAPLARVAEVATESFEQTFGPGLASERVIGLGTFRRGRRVAFALVTARRSAELVPWEPVDALGEVHIQGRLTTPGDMLFAVVNQGTHGFARCRVEPSVRVPDIDVRCPLAEGDETALVRLDVLTLGRVLGRPVARLLLRREPAAMPVYRASQTPVAPDEASDPAAALVHHLNEARRAAGLEPVRLAARESETHAQAAPHAAHALLRRDERVQDVLALGLLAGWSVEGGTIRDARQLVDVSVGSASAADWVAAALASPTGRVALLSPEAREVAVGAVALTDPPAMAAVVSSYAFFEGVDFDATAQRLLDRVERERVGRGLPPPRRMDGLDVLRHHAAQVSAGRMLPGDALQRGLDAEAQRRRRPLSGLQFETVNLELAPLPDALFARRELGLGVVVAHTRAPGAAWGQYVVYFLMDR